MITLIKSEEAIIYNRRLKSYNRLCTICTDLQMDSGEVSDRDKKLIIWNFMEEPWENYQNAVVCKRDTEFKFMHCYNVGLLTQFLKKSGVEGLPEKIVKDTLKEYGNEIGIIEIKDNMVKRTKKKINRMSET